MNNKVLNFDKFLSEKKRDTIDVTIYGKTYPVKCIIPAIVPVMLARAEAENDPQANIRMVMIAADAMFGKENVTEFCKNGMSGDELSELMQKLFQMINGNSSSEEDEGEELSDEDSRVVTAAGKKGKK